MARRTQMLTTWVWLAIALLLATSTVDARMQHKRLAKRQGGVVVSPTPDDDAGPSSAPPASSTPGGLLDPILGGGGTTASSVTVPVDVIPVSSSAPLISSTPLSTSSLLSSSSERVRSSSVPTLSSESITSTMSSESVSASASSAAQEGEEQKMGVGKKTIIIIASVAGSVGLVFAIWTILRKTKFSPSRKFERRLNPIQWTPENDLNDNTHAPDALMHRGGSDDSLSLKRGNSWGSNSGSQRGGGQMTEVGNGYANSQYAGSAAGVGAYNAAVPGYPPAHGRGGYIPEQQRPYPTGSQYTLGNPYEQVTRQAAPIHGGRYGENYNQFGDNYQRSPPHQF